jgi:hypothetical protein
MTGGTPPESHHQYSEVLVHSPEQPAEGQHPEDQNHPADKVADDAETAEPVVSGDVVVTVAPAFPVTNSLLGIHIRRSGPMGLTSRYQTPTTLPGLGVELIFPPSLSLLNEWM